MNIRWFEKSDAEAVSECLDHDWASDWTSESLVAALEKPIYRIRVATHRSHQQKITGVCIFTVVSDECNLLYIAVQPSMRQCGIGRALVEDLQTQLQHDADPVVQSNQLAVKNVFLEVRESNAAAIALYHASGFQQSGRRENYYPAVNTSNSDISKKSISKISISKNSISKSKANSKREAALLFSLAID